MPRCRGGGGAGLPPPVVASVVGIDFQSTPQLIDGFPVEQVGDFIDASIDGMWRPVTIKAVIGSDGGSDKPALQVQVQTLQPGKATTVTVTTDDVAPYKSRSLMATAPPMPQTGSFLSRKLQQLVPSWASVRPLSSVSGCVCVHCVKCAQCVRVCDCRNMVRGLRGLMVRVVRFDKSRRSRRAHLMTVTQPRRATCAVG